MQKIIKRYICIIAILSTMMGYTQIDGSKTINIPPVIPPAIPPVSLPATMPVTSPTTPTITAPAINIQQILNNPSSSTEEKAKAAEALAILKAQAAQEAQAMAQAQMLLAWAQAQARAQAQAQASVSVSGSGPTNPPVNNTTVPSPQPTPTWYMDNDRDGWNLKDVSQQRATCPGPGWTTTSNGVDCNDKDPAITNQCNPVMRGWYLDNDGDGYFAAVQGATTSPGPGWTSTPTKGPDCNDGLFSADNSVCSVPCTNKTVCPAGSSLVNCECQPTLPKPCDKAKIANHVYNTLNGFQETGQRELNDNKMHIVSPAGLPYEFNGFKWTDHDSSFNSTLYRVDNGNGNIEFIYATEGTVSFTDWENDIKQGLGYESEQYTLSVKNARTLAKWASDNGYKLSFTGHSLGGGLANANALATGLPATIYNPAGLHNNTITSLNLNLNNSKNVTAYVVNGDPVDFVNSATNTPVRGTTNYIGSTSQKTLTKIAGYALGSSLGSLYANYSLHSMDKVLSNLGCN